MGANKLFRFKAKRVGIILGADCNFNCKYCFRPHEYTKSINFPNHISNRMKKYLSEISPVWAESVSCTGGETLLYFDLVKEVFSYVPKDVHKLILTNGSLLTQEIVDYLNENDIEVHLSYDGEMTKFLRGVDVLENERILNLVRQIKHLMILTVMTSYNQSIKDNYEYIVNKLQRNDFIYASSAMIDCPETRWLIKDFNYDVFYKEMWYFLKNIYKKNPYYHTRDNTSTFEGVMIDLDGNLRNLYTFQRVGDITEHRDVIYQRMNDMGLYRYCNNNKECLIKNICRKSKQISSEHVCKCARVLEEFYNAR